MSFVAGSGRVPSSARRGVRATPRTSRARGRVESPTAAFFADLAARGHDPRVEEVSATVCFEARSGLRVVHWLVVMGDGQVTVTRRRWRRRADAVVHLDRSVMDALVTGRVSIMAAALRGELMPDGDLRALMVFQRLLPAPATDARRRRGHRGLGMV